MYKTRKKATCKTNPVSRSRKHELFITLSSRTDKLVGLLSSHWTYYKLVLIINCNRIVNLYCLRLNINKCIIYFRCCYCYRVLLLS